LVTGSPPDKEIDPMLQKLGKRLTLLNMVIAGAILLAMALVALGISEGTIAAQHERDLVRYANSVFSVLSRTMAGNIEYIIQTPERYAVVVENSSGELYVSAESQEMTEAARETALLAHQKLVERAGLGKTVAKETRGSSVTIVGEFGSSMQGPIGVVTSRIMWEAIRGVPIDFPSLVTTVNPFLLTGAGGARYRVSAMQVITLNKESLVFVIQDRGEELSAQFRLRGLFASSIVGGLVLIFIASLYLSRRAIEPIDKSIRQQRAFVAAASHELRTPLAALAANAEILRDAPLGEYAPYLESVLHVSSRMTLLVSDLMDLARADAGELSTQMLPVDANEVAAKAIQWMRPLAEQKAIEIIESLEPTEMIGDSDRVRQILLALLDNAVRYTPEGGRVFVSVERDGRYARIRVADTGEGIPGEHKAFIFDRFYRVDKARSRDNGGFGLGLSIVKQLVEQMEGDISLTDHESGGAQFDLRFKTVG